MANGTGRNTGHLPSHRQRIYNSDRCQDFDDLLDQAHADGKVHTLTAWPDGTPLADEADAWQLLGKMAACQHARRTYSVARSQDAGLGPIQLHDGTWAARYRVVAKDEGRDHIAAKAARGETLAFNPAQSQARPRGKYKCRTSMGGCGHKRAAEPETLCADCQRAQTVSDTSAYEHALQARSRGEGTQDARVWMLEHGDRKPVTPAEHAAVNYYLEQRKAQVERARQERQASQPASGGGVRALLDRWKSGNWA